MLKTSIWKQVGAALDMLDDAITLCPDSLWTAIVWDDEDDVRYGEFWFVAYHTLFWCDLFLTGTREGFAPPAPFIRDSLPEKPYSKEDVYTYLKQCRTKSKAIIDGLTDETAYRVCSFAWMQPTFLELQLYSMRHVQEHAAHLNLLLGKNNVAGLDWVAYARDEAS